MCNASTARVSVSICDTATSIQLRLSILFRFLDKFLLGCSSLSRYLTWEWKEREKTTRMMWYGPCYSLNCVYLSNSYANIFATIYSNDDMKHKASRSSNSFFLCLCFFFRNTKTLQHKWILCRLLLCAERVRFFLTSLHRIYDVYSSSFFFLESLETFLSDVLFFFYSLRLFLSL